MLLTYLNLEMTQMVGIDRKFDNSDNLDDFPEVFSSYNFFWRFFRSFLRCFWCFSYNFSIQSFLFWRLFPNIFFSDDLFQFFECLSGLKDLIHFSKLFWIDLVLGTIHLIRLQLVTFADGGGLGSKIVKIGRRLKWMLS